MYSVYRIRTILDAKDLTIEQGTSYTDVIFSGEGVLSNLGDASLQSLSDFLAEGLGLIQLLFRNMQMH